MYTPKTTKYSPVEASSSWWPSWLPWSPWSWLSHGSGASIIKLAWLFVEEIQTREIKKYYERCEIFNEIRYYNFEKYHYSRSQGCLQPRTTPPSKRARWKIQIQQTNPNASPRLVWTFETSIQCLSYLCCVFCARFVSSRLSTFVCVYVSMAKVGISTSSRNLFEKR